MNDAYFEFTVPCTFRYTVKARGEKEAREKLNKGDYLDVIKPIEGYTIDYSKAKLEKVT